MRIQSEICHIEQGRTIVKAIALEKDIILATAHAEDLNVEIAEDNAIERVISKLDLFSNRDVRDKPIQNAKKYEVKKEISTEVSKSEISKGSNIERSKTTNRDPQKTVPIDWSEELSMIDFELKKLGWNRQEENSFLIKNFKYTNRDRITNYEDIISYLKMLKELNHINSNKGSPERHELISQSDVLLSELGWDKVKGRNFLESKMNKNTRDILSNNELRKFITLLKSELQTTRVRFEN